MGKLSLTERDKMKLTNQAQTEIFQSMTSNGAKQI